MNFIKKTLLPSSKSSLNISALCLNNQSIHESKVKYLQQDLHSEYELLKSQLKNIKHLPKYHAYLESFQILLDNKNSLLNKKLETLMTSLHFSGKKKQKQIPLLEAFLDFSLIERFKFLIDLVKNAEQHQKDGQKQKSQSPYNSPAKRSQMTIEQSRVKIFSQASISLNELKTMSLSYWTKVNFELNCQKRQLKVTGKQSCILYLQNYLVRLSKNEKYCLVLLCCNPEQVPSWLRKVYIQIKKQIFVQVFQGIWNEIILIQLEKMQVSFEQINKDIQSSPTKSMTTLSVNQEQFQIHKDGYSVFLTPLTIKSYTNEKAKFTTKIKNKLKFSLYKEIEFDGVQSESIKQKLQKISFSKASDEKNRDIYQAKGYFNIPASVVKFKFIDSLKERNKFISSWEILENEPSKYIQAISQSLDFSQLFSNESISLDPQIFKFKQLSLKEQAIDFTNNKWTQILTLQSIKQISKSSVMNFLVVECEQKRHQKSQLTVICEFNKHLIKRKIHKLKIDTISKQKMQEISKKVIENFMKEMILMIFTQQKMYEEKQINNEMEFFTICEAFNNDIDELDIFSTKSIQLEEEVAEIGQNREQYNEKYSEPQRYSQGSPKKIKKSSSIDDQVGEKNHLVMKKALSLDFERQSTPQKQHFQEEEVLQQGPKDPSAYIKAVFTLNPKYKTVRPHLVKKNLLADEWLRLEEGGMTCINEAKIKDQKQIIKKILIKLGETILKQKNFMHVSLPVTIFKTESQLTTVARGLTYAPLLLQPQCYTSSQKANHLQRLKKAILFLISNSYSQINFQKPFNPILGETVQYWIDGCPVYFEQISHHPPVTSYYMLGRGYKIFGSMQPSLSMGINHAKVNSRCIDNIEFEDGTKLNAGANKMLVNGTTFGLRTFNFDQKNYIYDSTNNILALFSYGPIKKGLFSTSSQPSDFTKGRIMKMSEQFKNSEYKKWKNSDYSLKKQWIERQISVFEGIWSKKVFFDGVEYFDFDTQRPYELVPQKNPLLSDSRYRDDLQWLIKGDLDKSQEYKQKMQEAQRYDKKLRTKNK